MSSTPGFDFSKFVPGFDFLQSLAQQTSQKPSQIPNLGHWVAPTINVEELEKRIEELKAVLFWLDQNATALKATVQALEVQKMTLTTLRGMNFSMGDLAEAFRIKTPVAEPPAQAASSATASEPTAAPAPAAETTAADATATKPAGVVDPLQWWNALATQFQQIAASAVSDPAMKKAVDDTSHLAANLAKEAFKGAEVLTQSLKDAAKPAGAGTKPAAKSNVGTARKSAAKTAVKAATKPVKTVKKSAAPAKTRLR